MMAQRKARITGMLLMGLSLHAPAAASPIQPDGRRAFQTPAGVAVLADNENDRQLWVLPPTQGSIGSYMTQFSVTRGQCQTLSSVIEEQGEIHATLRTLRSRARSLSLELAAEGASVESVARARARLDAVQDLIDQQEEDVNAFFVQQNATSGGTISVLYNTGWQAAASDVRTANPTYVVQPVRTDGLRILFSIPDSVPGGVSVEELPIIRSYTVNGRPPDNLTIAGGPMPDTLQVDIGLSRLGACYVRYHDLFGTDYQPRFGLTALYKHPIAFRSSVEAAYNYENIYKFVSESSKSGGLFSSSSHSSAMMSNWGEAAIDFKWKQTDPQNRLSSAERIEAERAIKEDLLASAASLMTQPAVGTPTAEAPGPRGATVIAEGLEKGCGPNPKCIAAALGFRALDAIFGSSSSSTSITKDIRYSGTYKSSSEDTRMVDSGTIFTF